MANFFQTTLNFQRKAMSIKDADSVAKILLIMIDPHYW